MQPVHTFVELDLCPQCRGYYKEVAEPVCRACNPSVPAEDLTRWRRDVVERLAAEAADGSVGSLAGLGFAPVEPWDADPPQPFLGRESPSRLRVRDIRPPAEVSDPEAALRLVLLTGVLMAAAYLLYQLTAR